MRAILVLSFSSDSLRLSFWGHSTDFRLFVFVFFFFFFFSLYEMGSMHSESVVE